MSALGLRGSAKPLPDVDAGTKTHAVFFIHGYGGTVYDWENLVSKLPVTEEHFYHICAANSFSAGTTDGLEAGVSRLFEEISNIIKKSSKLKKISLVGHSLGGIFARGVSQKLFEKDFFGLKPELFTTFASPHLGIRRPQNTIFNNLFHAVVRKLSKTTNELSLNDSALILHAMSKQTECLQAYQRRVLYANVFNDINVPYCTASISRMNPYRKRVRKTFKTKDKGRHESIDSEDDYVTAGEEDDEPSYKHVSLLSYPTSFRCSKEFPHVTTYSLYSEHRSDYRSSHGPFAKNDARRETLDEMLTSLNSLTFERYDCVFPRSVLAHEQIINKRQGFAGDDLSAHFSNVLHRGNAETLSNL